MARDDGRLPAPPYTVPALADRWQCSKDFVYSLIRNGELNAFRLGGKLLRIAAKEVERFEQRNTVGSPHQE